MAKRRKKKTSPPPGKIALICVICLLIGVVGGFLIEAMMAESPTEQDSPKGSASFTSDSLQFHFLELGNKYTGDCTYIKAGDNDILIDAGSKRSSIETIDTYLKQYVTDGTLEYVIVTHAHEDHYAGFATNEKTDSIFDLYECETIIDFAMTNQAESSVMYSNYKRELADEIAAGATHYTAAECIETGNSIFDLGDGITMEILDSSYYTNRYPNGENNYSVCTLFRQGDRSFLFTGDLEKSGAEYLVEMNDLPKVTLYKAGHHGSKTSSNKALLEVIRPEYVCVCCCAGSPEYTKVNENQFPTQDFIDRVAPYTDKVYVTTLCTDYENGKFTSMNGNITLTSDTSGVRVDCSGDPRLLRESDWFAACRTCPKEWKKDD